jgi:hypothetical protein
MRSSIWRTNSLLKRRKLWPPIREAILESKQLSGMIAVVNGRPLNHLLLSN